MKRLIFSILVISVTLFVFYCGNFPGSSRSPLKATMGDMKTVANAVEDYMTDNAMVPGAGEAAYVKDLEKHLLPFYIKTLPTHDGWGNPLIFLSGKPDTPQALCYSVISYGRDGKDSGIDPRFTNYLTEKTADFNNDICFSNGNFTYAPRVK